MVFDQSKNHLIIVLTNQNDKSKILIKNANLGLVKNYTTQSQWTGSKWFVQKWLKGFFYTYPKWVSFYQNF